MGAVMGAGRGRSVAAERGRGCPDPPGDDSGDVNGKKWTWMSIFCRSGGAVMAADRGRGAWVEHFWSRDPEIRNLRGRFPPSGFVFQEFHCVGT